MENNTQNKAKFFAQYLGCDVVLGYSCRVRLGEYIALPLQDFHLSRSYLNDPLAHTAENPVPKLYLKSLNNISDNDAISIADIAGNSSYTDDRRSYNGRLLVTDFLFKVSNVRANEWQEIFDFLRSKCYAMPYLGLSVEKQVEYGWVLLR